MSEPTHVAEIKHDIERTRAELADTVDALAAKLDVKAQVKAQAKHRATEVADRLSEDRQRIAVIAGGAVVVLLVIRRLQKRQKHHRAGD